MKRRTQAKRPGARPGPIERASFRSKLQLEAVGHDGLLFGESIVDLVTSGAAFDDVMFLALTRRRPSETERAAFAAGLAAAALVNPGAGALHAAVLSRVLRLPIHTLAATTLLAFDRDVDTLVVAAVAHVRDEGPLPKSLLAQSPDEARLARALLRRANVAAPSARSRNVPGVIATAVRILLGAGLSRPEELFAAFRLARLPMFLAEALATPLDFTSYPMKTPPFVYESS